MKILIKNYKKSILSTKVGTKNLVNLDLSNTINTELNSATNLHFFFSLIALIY